MDLAPKTNLVSAVDLDAGNIHYKGHWRGGTPKIETFLGPEMAMSKASAIGPKKGYLTLYRLQSRLQHMYHAGILGNPMPESTLTLY